MILELHLFRKCKGEAKATHPNLFYFAYFIGVGLLVVFLVSLYTLKLWYKMQELNEEMKNAD